MERRDFITSQNSTWGTKWKKKKNRVKNRVEKLKKQVYFTIFVSMCLYINPFAHMFPWAQLHKSLASPSEERIAFLVQRTLLQSACDTSKQRCPRAKRRHTSSKVIYNPFCYLFFVVSLGLLYIHFVSGRTFWMINTAHSLTWKMCLSW